MLFQSQVFVFLFLPAVLAIHYSLAGRVDRQVSVAFLVGASFFFYGWFEPAYISLLVASVAGNFVVGRWLTSRRTKRVLVFAVAANLALLGAFKYTGFFIANVNWVSGGDVLAPDILLPLAISFFTFQQIAYLVDIYRARAPHYSLLDYTLFIVFFPQLIAGPIVHHSEMLPQIARIGQPARHISLNLSIGLTIFVVGLFKKVVIADTAGIYADVVFDGVSRGVEPQLFDAWLGSFAYGFQIYFDFSGYFDMAVGAARMFGLKLPINFYSPYRASSIVEFWRRWNITLSRFLRDYLYFPLGGNRKGTGRRYVNLMAVMLIGGLWHGASWNFVIWGGLHGVFLVINHLWRGIWPGSTRTSHMKGLVGWLLTILVVTFAWVPFRASDLDTTLSIMWAMLGGNGVAVPGALYFPLGGLAPVLQGWGVEFGSGMFRAIGVTVDPTKLGWLVLAGVIAFLCPNLYQWLDRFRPVLHYRRQPSGSVMRKLKWRPTMLWAAVIVAMLLFSIDYQANSVEFLYFQF